MKTINIVKAFVLGLLFVVAILSIKYHKDVNNFSNVQKLIDSPKPFNENNEIFWHLRKINFSEQHSISSNENDTANTKRFAEYFLLNYNNVFKGYTFNNITKGFQETKEGVTFSMELSVYGMRISRTEKISATERVKVTVLDTDFDGIPEYGSRVFFTWDPESTGFMTDKKTGVYVGEELPLTPNLFIAMQGIFMDELLHYNNLPVNK